MRMPAISIFMVLAPSCGAELTGFSRLAPGRGARSPAFCGGPVDQPKGDVPCPLSDQPDSFGPLHARWLLIRSACRPGAPRRSVGHRRARRARAARPP